ncbi:MAG: hypothetical protein A3K18_21130 [Lentisphaerae bacterium RIFOXYA12_64_32]|nr:MAG: hypothetical protein A3K18_21130 [Lentisphaerae bacterium RIFOXYA12_64_32]
MNFVKKYYALGVVLAVFLWALYEVASYRIKESPIGTTTLRIGHWQLETGVRDGFVELAGEYQKLHPNVRILQDAIPEGVYGTWMSTQFLGGTMSDMVEMGLGLPYQVILSYYNRYCVPITPCVNLPNPYNKGTELEDTPLRDTYRDGMITGYTYEMQEYMTVPLSRFATRVFYNKDLLRKLCGRDEPPKDFREFIGVCEQIATKVNSQGQPYTPIVGSKYHFGIWEWSLCNVLTYRLIEKADFNRDGFVDNSELYVAVKAGLVSFHDRPIEGKFKMVRDITRQCQAGFTGLSRDEGVFLFAQQRAVFMTTGTWDARSLQEQAKGKFEVALMDFPMPSQDDPEYGDLVVGPRYENPGTGFSFAVVRTGQDPEVAQDFLLFLASQKQNERLNKIIGWIPAIVGTETDPLLAGFKPCLDGVYGNFNVNLGGETWIKWLQLFSLYQVNQISYDDLVKEFEPFYKEHGLIDFQEQQRDWRRSMTLNEQLLSGIRAQALFAATPEDAAPAWVKYRTLTRDNQILPELLHAQQMHMVEKGMSKDALGPYEYSQKARQRIKADLAKRTGS